MLKDAGRYGKNEVLTRLDIPFYKRKGYEHTYLGPSVYNSVKYTFRYRDQLYAGGVAEKDAGEPFAALHNRYGYDYAKQQKVLRHLFRQLDVYKRQIVCKIYKLCIPLIKHSVKSSFIIHLFSYSFIIFWQTNIH